MKKTIKFSLHDNVLSMKALHYILRSGGANETAFDTRQASGVFKGLSKSNSTRKYLNQQSTSKEENK